MTTAPLKMINSCVVKFWIVSYNTFPGQWDCFFGFLLGDSFHGITAFLMEGWIIMNIMSKYVGGGGEGRMFL